MAFDTASASLRGRKSRRLGALVLSEQPMPVAPDDETAHKLAAGIAALGIGRLPWSKALRQWRDRVMFLRASEGDEWPDLSDAALAKTVDNWLTPTLAAKIALSEITADELATALHALLPWPLPRRLDAEAPTHFEAPTGSQVPIDYDAEGGPKSRSACRNCSDWTVIRPSPAEEFPSSSNCCRRRSVRCRPRATCPASGAAATRRCATEMRGRYPKHPWPDDPLAASPTRRAKPRNR